MSRLLLVLALLSLTLPLSAQRRNQAAKANAAATAAVAPAGITAEQLRATVAALAHDSLQGRMTGTPGIDKAAQYLEREFRRIGLQPWPGSNAGYRQTFTLSDRSRQRLGLQGITNAEAFNVIGYLPGKTRPNEYIIVSAHYDHIGVSLHLQAVARAGGIDKLDTTTRAGKYMAGMYRRFPTDSISNGADDDASGVAAMLALADYWAKRGDNARSLLFVGFTAEEIGLVGSEHFGTTIDPKQVIGMVNIEMIGLPNPIGVYLTGYDKSNLGELLKAGFPADLPLGPDPYPSQNLFLRSDNASLARLGVPAHTFSTAPMETHSTYHTPGDEVQTLDYAHMARVVNALAAGTAPLIQGTATPSRVN